MIQIKIPYKLGQALWARSNFGVWYAAVGVVKMSAYPTSHLNITNCAIFRNEHDEGRISVFIVLESQTY